MWVCLFFDNFLIKKFRGKNLILKNDIKVNKLNNKIFVIMSCIEIV